MVSEQVQQLVVQAQSLQQQMQMVSAQKEALNIQLLETGKALEELAKPAKDDVYKVVGPVLVKVGRDEARRDLESKKELVMVRMKTMERSEAKLREKLEEIKEKLTKAG